MQGETRFGLTEIELTRTIGYQGIDGLAARQRIIITFADIPSHAG